MASESVPLETFVERIGAAFGTKVVHELDLAGTVTVRSRVRVGPGQALSLFAAIASLHGLRLELRPEGSLLLRDSSEANWEEIQRRFRVPPLWRIFDRLTRAWRGPPIDSVSVLGRHGFVVLLRSDVDLSAVGALQDVLDAPVGSTPAQNEVPTYRLDFEQARFDVVLRSVFKIVRWSGVSDPDYVGPCSSTPTGPRRFRSHTSRRMPARCSPCRLQHLQPRRILIWDDLEIRSLSDFLGAVLESHDLIAREGRGGEIELAPRASCLAARSIDPSAGPHPALARLGLGTSDRIVSVDGAALESSPSQLAEHLRSQESALLGVQSPNGKVRGLKIRAAVLLAMLQPLSR